MIFGWIQQWLLSINMQSTTLEQTNSANNPSIVDPSSPPSHPRRRVRCRRVLPSRCHLLRPCRRPRCSSLLSSSSSAHNRSPCEQMLLALPFGGAAVVEPSPPPGTEIECQQRYGEARCHPAELPWQLISSYPSSRPRCCPHRLPPV